MKQITKAQIRQLHRENKTYPDALVEIPKEKHPEIPPGIRTGSTPLRAFRSKKFLLVEWAEADGQIRLSIMRTEYDPDTCRPRDGIGWDDLQRLKGEAGYGDYCAVEIYPPDADVVNVANMRHLFILKSPPAMMWRDA